MSVYYDDMIIYILLASYGPGVRPHFCLKCKAGRLPSYSSYSALSRIIVVLSSHPVASSAARTVICHAVSLSCSAHYYTLYSYIYLYINPMAWAWRVLVAQLLNK